LDVSLLVLDLISRHPSDDDDERAADQKPVTERPK
jgi:hypothetical protein